MSGGVDSSVTAYLMKEAGYEVIGAHMLLSERGASNVANIHDLEETCKVLSIPLNLLDFRKEFNDCVISYFCREYARGYTPNPCVVCNKEVKFGLLLKWALENGAEYLATGHYVRVESSPSGFHLMKAVSLENEQSYFLYRLDQEQLKHVVFPIGSMISKPDVRKLAKVAGLPVSEKPKSRDICFVPDGDYRTFIEKFVPPEPGDIVDTGGNILGRHQGLANYTVGQRQGLGVSTKEPLYVLSFDIRNNRVVAGSKEELLSYTVLLRDVNWVSGKAPENLRGITSKIRYRAKEVAVKIDIGDNRLQVEFSEPQLAVTPGQSLVFYRDEEALGGGVIMGREDAAR